MLEKEIAPSTLPKKMREVYAEAKERLERQCSDVVHECILTKVDFAPCLLADIGDGYDCEIWVHKYYKRDFKNTVWCLCIWKNRGKIVERYLRVPFEETIQRILGFQKGSD